MYSLVIPPLLFTRSSMDSASANGDTGHLRLSGAPMAMGSITNCGREPPPVKATAVRLALLGRIVCWTKAPMFGHIPCQKQLALSRPALSIGGQKALSKPEGRD